MWYLIILGQVRTNPGASSPRPLNFVCHKFHISELCTDITILAPRIFRWLLDFWKSFPHVCLGVLYQENCFPWNSNLWFSTPNVEALGSFDKSIPKTTVFFPFNGILYGLAIESIIKYTTKESDYLLCSCYWQRKLQNYFILNTVVWTSWLHLASVILKTKPRGLSPRADYTDRAAAAGRRS